MLIIGVPFGKTSERRNVILDEKDSCLFIFREEKRLQYWCSLLSLFFLLRSSGCIFLDIFITTFKNLCADSIASNMAFSCIAFFI